MSNNLIDIRAKEVLSINSGDKNKSIEYILKTKSNGIGSYNSNPIKKLFWELVIEKIKAT
jgi:hypothetical protein